VQYMFFQTQPVIKSTKGFQSRKCHSETYCKFSAPNKLYKFWIQVWATAKETSSQTWLIPKINGDKLNYSYNLPGTCTGHCHTPLHLESNPAVTIPDNKPSLLLFFNRHYNPCLGFCLLSYRWAFSAGRFYRVPLPAARQTPNLEEKIISLMCCNIHIVHIF
jgi:hypothetical protein